MLSLSLMLLTPALTAGLSLPELVQAVQMLLSMGQNAQSSHYNEWLEMSRASMPAGVLYRYQSPYQKSHYLLAQSCQLKLYFLAHQLAC